MPRFLVHSRMQFWQLAPTLSLYNGALDQAQRLKAAEAIESEAKGESGKMIREQLQTGQTADREAV